MSSGNTKHWPWFHSFFWQVSLATCFGALLHYVKLVAKTTITDTLFFVTTGVAYSVTLILFLTILFDLQLKITRSTKNWNIFVSYSTNNWKLIQSWIMGVLPKCFVHPTHDDQCDHLDTYFPPPPRAERDSNPWEITPRSLLIFFCLERTLHEYTYPAGSCLFCL